MLRNTGAQALFGSEHCSRNPRFPGRPHDQYLHLQGQPTDTPNACYQTAAGTGTSAKYNFVNSLR